MKFSVSTKYKKVMNLELKTKENCRWAAVAWEEEAVRLENEVQKGHVYHFDGLYVQDGNELGDYDFGKKIKFTIKSNTVLNDLTKMYLLPNTLGNQSSIENLKKYSSIQQCVDENFKNNTAIGLTGFIKIPFVQCNQDLPLRWGALTDGSIKITTMIKNYNDPDIVFQVGQSVTAYGKIFEYKEKAAFEILHVKDVIVHDSGHKDEDDLEYIVKTPKRPTRVPDTHTEKSVVKVRKD
ncbi:hypothetical protein QAD02_011323 [Eretmocerus hayati]|uniref:Uncharacterized protein n=1 Tax=Eretmocerus hayati TaxID=131215 RepID=A0ACC2NZ89_9HYME|nr:hypothetical protein QAD02_011323 [Eretmocerus hayati]